MYRKRREINLAQKIQYVNSVFIDYRSVNMYKMQN